MAETNDFDAMPSIADLLRQGLQTPGSPVDALAVEAAKNFGNIQSPTEFAGTLTTVATFVKGDA